MLRLPQGRVFRPGQRERRSAGSAGRRGTRANPPDPQTDLRPIMEQTPDRQRLNELAAGIAKAQAEAAPPPSRLPNAQPPGGLRMGTDFAACVLVGIVIGFGIDRWLGTAPFGLIALFLLGIAAGFYSLWRLLQKPAGGGMPAAAENGDKNGGPVVDGRD